MAKNHRRKVGAHVSAAGGLEQALVRAAAIGANCAQVFSGSPRVWARKDLATIDVDKFYSKQKELSISPIFTHALYLSNLASEKPELRQKSYNALKYDLEFDSLISGAGVIVHLGSHQGRGWESAMDQVAGLISQLLAETPANSTFLIENAASNTGKVGGELSEIQWLIEEIDSPRLGWCLDTCHAHAAGLSLGAAGTGEAPTALEEIERHHLWQSLRCIHVNDSRDQRGSHRDRHANLGDGMIPTADLRFFLNVPQVKKLPLILEVPGTDKSGPDAENIKRLYALLEE